MTITKPHEARVSGKVAHAARSIARGKSLAGIEVCSLDGCVRTDREGRHILQVKGVGSVPVWLEAYAWADALHGVLPVPRYHELHSSRPSMQVNVESQAQATWDPTVFVEHAPRGE